MAYTNKLMEYVNTQNANLLEKSEANPIINATSIDGKRYSIPMSQSRIIQKSLCTAVYTPASAYGAILSGGSQVDFNIKLSTVLTNAYDIALHLTVLNDTGADVSLFPINNWFNRIEFRFNSSIIQQFYSTDLYNYLWLYVDQQWRRLSDLWNLNDRFLWNDEVLINGQSTEFILLMPGNIFAQTSMFCPALNVEFVFRLYMNQQNQIVADGAAPTISSMTLEFITSHASIDDVSRLFNSYRSGNFMLRYSWFVNQTVPIQSMQPNQRYEILMSSFTGIFNYIQFIAQYQNPIGLPLMNSRRVLSFDVLDENGLSLFNNNNYQTDPESLIWDSSIVNPWTRFDEIRNVYKFPFSLSPRDDILKGTLHGFMPCFGKNRLVINTGPAAVPKIITWTRSGVPASGVFRIVYTYFGQSYYSPWLAYNETAANIKAAVELFVPFQQYGQVVTVSSTLVAGNPTVTYSAEQELAFDEYDTNSVLAIESQMFTAAAAFVSIDATISQQPQDGWFTADYNIVIMGTQVRHLAVTQQGSISIKES